MARRLEPGTPDRTKKYVFPPPTGRRVLVLSLAVAAALTVAVFGLSLGGVERLVSPGPLASGHAPLDARCEQCHARGVAADLRCERCHDTGGFEDFRVRAHARFGADISPLNAASDAARRTERRTTLRCAECHGDHRGRGFNLKRVSDLQCARCHRTDTPSLEQHVEFPLVRAKATQPRGMKITHERHIQEALARLLGKKKAAELTLDEKAQGLKGTMLQRTCESCHVATANLAGFEPIEFDRHCVECHTSGGSVGATDPVPVADVVPIEKIPAPWAAGQTGQFTARRDRVTKTFLAHEDPWVLFNLAKIRREVDPAGYFADRTALSTQIASALRAGISFPLSRASDADVAARAAALETEIAALGKPSATGAGVDRQALQSGLLAFAQAALLAGPEGSAAAAPLDGLKGRAAAEPLARLASPEASARRAELLAALESVRERAAASRNVLLGRRVDLLLRRIVDWRPGAPGDSDALDTVGSRRLERERLLDELDYRKRVKTMTVPPVARIADRKNVEARAAEARERLNALASLEALPVHPLEPAERASRLETADSLTIPCRKCHDTGVASFAPLAIDLPVMPRSVFNHKPHVRVRDCAFCHAEGGKGVLVSKSARDVLIPPVASCRTCHKPSEARSDCATCHKFHPPDYPPRPGARHPSTALLADLNPAMARAHGEVIR